MRDESAKRSSSRGRAGRLGRRSLSVEGESSAQQNLPTQYINMSAPATTSGGVTEVTTGELLTRRKGQDATRRMRLDFVDVGENGSSEEQNTSPEQSSGSQVLAQSGMLAIFCLSSLDRHF